MPIRSFLVSGDCADISEPLKEAVPDPSSLSALVLLSLGVDHAKLLDVALGLGPPSCPVYMAETYGIVGFDLREGRNRELMEKGRGKEYGCRGGDGGQGCVVVAYTGASVRASHESIPPGVSSIMAVTDSSGVFGKAVAKDAPIYYGGITKECFVLTGGTFKSTPFFCVGSCGEPVGVAAVQGDVGDATEDMLQQLPEGRQAGGIAMFPCFTRGINEYGENDVEPAAISAKLPGCRVFGMFAHGELGPSAFSGFCPPADAAQPCTQHSMTTVMAIHTDEAVEAATS